MTPADARESENKMKLQNRYTLIYKEYNPENNRIISAGDNVCISAYKGIFDKGNDRICQWKYLQFIMFKIQNLLHIY